MYLKQSIQVGGRELTLETGKIAKQANGAVLLSYGETMVLTTAVGTAKPREGIDFFPLTVEYREYGYAAGRIPGNYFRREGRPSEKETLTSRLTDRPIRPLFSRAIGATRRSSAWCCRPTPRTTRTCSRSPARLPRSTSRTFRSRRPLRASALVSSMASTSSSLRTISRATRAQPHRRRLRRSHRHGRSGSQEVPRNDGRGFVAGHREIQRFADG